MNYVRHSVFIGLVLLLAACNSVLSPDATLSVQGAPLTGAIFTTGSTCTGVNLNIYGSKDAVHLDGGPSHPGAAGLPDGAYYVQVTEPNGTVLGQSVGTAVTVSGGEFAACYQLSAILRTASSGYTTPGYDDTSNPGGEYKVWVSTSPTFENSASKTDNFKVEADGGGTPPQATLNVLKFYDLDTDGIQDGGEAAITGWKVRIQDGIDYLRYTPVSIIVVPDEYTVTEFAPLESNWFHTTANPVLLTLADGDTQTATFGNVCVGAGGGKTLGFWSNKNGQALYGQALLGADDLTALVALNLRIANGSAFNPTSYAQVRTWLLSATATNMAYMLSAQLAAMKLNVHNGSVSGNALIYAPAVNSANANGFATIEAVIAEANTSLGTNGLTTTAGAVRSYQEALKNALDRANNNLNFVQAQACPFTFAD